MSLQEKIHKMLISQGKTLALAESCTGGYLATKFTSIPDASKYFLGSFVTYSNTMKEVVINVSKNTLINHGAVSRETADEMLLGLMKLSGADYGIAVTGMAGPSGGTEDKPVGTVFIAVGAKGKKPHVLKCHFEGDREAVIEATTQRALDELDQLMQG